MKLPKPIEDLMGVTRLLDPKLLVRLKDAGAFDPRRAVGAVGTLPWLLGRGPSLGILTQLHAAAQGDQIALVDREGPLTWSELDSRANTGTIYWEGAVRVSGSLENNAVEGKGYVEMTGYGRAFRAP